MQKLHKLAPGVVILSLYCIKCGGWLTSKTPDEPNTCPNCESKYEPHYNFCGQCGLQLKTIKPIL